MIYSVFDFNLLLIRGYSLAINKVSLILIFPSLRTIASILIMIIFAFIECLWNEDACVSRCSLILMWRGLIVLPI